MTSTSQPIPPDWRVQTLADLGGKVTSGSRGWAKYYADHGSLFVRITNLDRNNIHLDLEDPRYVQIDPNEAEARRTRLATGDLLISITADIGIIGYVDDRTPTPAYINQHIARVRLDPRLVDSRFVAYYLASWEPQRRFIGSTDQGAKAGMNLTTIATLSTLVPPIQEQSRIADALADIDDLIARLARRIAKKQAINQGLMQQLLTGRTRLPGFSEAWSTASLGEVATLQRGFDLPTRLRRPGSVPVVSSSGVSGWHDRAMVKAPGVITGRYGTIGDVFFGATDFWPLNTTLWVSDFHGNDVRFIYYLLRRVDFASHSGKSGVPGVNRNDLHSEIVSLPDSVAEQQAIATALDDVEQELGTLQDRLTKARNVKTGMMQQLLTGRTRLPLQEAAL